MNVDAGQPGALERRGQLGEQQRVGRQRESPTPVDPREPLDDFDQVGAQRRLASGQAKLAKADADRGARDHLDLGGQSAAPELGRKRKPFSGMQ